MKLVLEQMKIWLRSRAGATTPNGLAEQKTEDKENEDSPHEPSWRAIAKLVDAEGFQVFVGVIIVFNAVVLGPETYSGVMARYSAVLNGLNTLFYGVVLVELILRLLSSGTKPWNFARHGWNIFDLVVIGDVPFQFVRDQAIVLRLLRLARIVRLMRFLPDAGILLAAVTRAKPAVMSMVVLTFLVIFVYGILGWMIFGPALPDQWGNVGVAMMALFILLTLEAFPNYLAEAQQLRPLATVFFLSYVLIAALVIVNLLIGIVISSMERAREEESADARRRGQTYRAFLLEQITAMRRSLDKIEGGLDRSIR